MVVFFAEKEAVVFVAAQVVAHDCGQQIDDLMDLLLAHARHEGLGEAIIAEVLQKGDEGLFVRGAVESEEH